MSSLHQLNRRVVGAGVKEGPVELKVRNGTVLFGGGDTLVGFSCHVSCTLVSRDPEHPARAEAGRAPLKE